MRWNRTLLALPLLLLVPLPAPAGFLFGKKASKPDPAARVPELIVTVKTDGDEGKRAAAAEELRQYDPTAQPDIIPILVDVLMHDAKPSVRAEAAVSLGKLRPVNPQAGWALEQAAAHDSSMRVRLQARSALMMYHVAGYRSPKTDEPPLNEAAKAKDKEKKEAPPAGMPPAVKTTPPAKTTSAPSFLNRLVPVASGAKAAAPPAGRVVGETAPPPLAPEPPPQPAKPAPAAAPPTPLVPAAPPALQPAPASPPTEVQGPDLTPPG